MENFVDEIRGLLKTLDIDAKIKQGINLNIGTIELHLTDDEPNPSIIRESLKSLRTIGENVAGSLLGTALLPPALISSANYRSE